MKKSKLFALVLAVVLTLSSLVPSFASVTEGMNSGKLNPNLTMDRKYLFENVKIGKPVRDGIDITVYLEAVGKDYLVVRNTKEEAVKGSAGQRLIVFPRSLYDKGYSDGHLSTAAYKTYAAGDAINFNLGNMSSNFKTKANPNGVIVATSIQSYHMEKPVPAKVPAPKDDKELHKPIFVPTENKNSKSSTGYTVGTNTFKITENTLWGVNPKVLSTENMPSMMTVEELLEFYSWGNFTPDILPKGKDVKGDEIYDYPSPYYNTYSRVTPEVKDGAWYTAANVFNYMDMMTEYSDIFVTQGRFVKLISRYEIENAKHVPYVVLQIPNYLTWEKGDPKLIQIEKNYANTLLMLELDPEYAKSFPVNLVPGQEVVVEVRPSTKREIRTEYVKFGNVQAQVLKAKATAVFDAWFFYDAMSYLNENF